MAVEAPARRGSNRAFWAFLAALVIGSIVLVALIFLNRPMVVRGAEFIARDNLRRAQAAAVGIAAETGSLDAAEPRLLREAVPDLLFIDPDQASNEPDIISVYATAEVWIGAARPSTGGCQWIRIDAAGVVETGSSTDCSAETIVGLDPSPWPSPEA